MKKGSACILPALAHGEMITALSGRINLAI